MHVWNGRKVSDLDQNITERISTLETSPISGIVSLQFSCDGKLLVGVGSDENHMVRSAGGECLAQW